MTKVNVEVIPTLAIKCLSVFKIILKSLYLLVSSKSFRCLLRVTPSSQVSATIRGKIGDVTFRATIGEMGQDWMEARVGRQTTKIFENVGKFKS